MCQTGVYFLVFMLLYFLFRWNRKHGHYWKPCGGKGLCKYQYEFHGRGGSGERTCLWNCSMGWPSPWQVRSHGWARTGTEKYWPLVVTLGKVAFWEKNPTFIKVIASSSLCVVKWPIICLISLFAWSSVFLGFRMRNVGLVMVHSEMNATSHVHKNVAYLWSSPLAALIVAFPVTLPQMDLWVSLFPDQFIP